MTNINIKRAVDNIRSGTTVYTPLVETIVNSIQAIEAAKITSGKVKILVQRSDQTDLLEGLPGVRNYVVTDNGIGFTSENRKSFDTLYSDYKIEHGGKGFGRFTCLKYFEEVTVDSVFEEDGKHHRRTFGMGLQTDIIVDEKVELVEDLPVGSTITLNKVKGRGFLDKRLATIARTLVERLLPYFIDTDYNCPTVEISEENGSGTIVLNEFVNNQLSAAIQEITYPGDTIALLQGGISHNFKIRIFKIYPPRNQKSKISLVADRREVTDTPIHNYIHEFIDEFYDDGIDGAESRDRNYIVKSYVFGNYLDENVSLERGGFEFPRP